MLRSGRITLVVMISAMVLTRSSAEEESTFSSLVSKSHARCISIRHSKSRSGKDTDHGHKTHGTWDMEPLSVKLNTVFDRYEVNCKEMKKLYKSVLPCMPDKCGKPQHKKYKMPKKIKCSKSKNRKSLKHKIVKILSKFHIGVRSFSERFQNLTSLLEGCSESRLIILKEFKNDFKMLDKEVEMLTRIRLKNVTKRLVAPLRCSRLAYLELKTLHDSERFLFAWKENLSNVFTCWKKNEEGLKEKSGLGFHPFWSGQKSRSKAFLSKSVPFVRQRRCLITDSSSSLSFNLL